MHHMVVLVLEELEKWPEILEAWEMAGVPGVTILESTGLGRMRRLTAMRDDLPIMPSIASVMHLVEAQHRTIFTIVDSEELVDRLIDVTQTITGDLNHPNTGILFVVPVSRAIGVTRGSQE